MELKLGLDIGVASVGWGIIDENYNVIDSGVRLFPEGSAEENLTRRTMRTQQSSTYTKDASSFAADENFIIQYISNKFS